MQAEIKRFSSMGTRVLLAFVLSIMLIPAGAFTAFGTQSTEEGSSSMAATQEEQSSSSVSDQGGEVTLPQQTTASSGTLTTSTSSVADASLSQVATAPSASGAFTASTQTSGSTATPSSSAQDEAVAQSEEPEASPQETGGFGLVLADSTITAANGAKNFSNTQHDPASEFNCEAATQYNMKLQFNFPTSATDKRVEITLPTELEWVDCGGETAKNNSLITSYSGPTDQTNISHNILYNWIPNNGKYTFNVAPNTNQFVLNAQIKALFKIYGDAAGQLFQKNIKVETYYNGALQDTSYSGDYRIIHNNGNHTIAIASSALSSRYYTGPDNAIDVNAWNAFGLMHRDSAAGSLIADNMTFTLQPEKLVNSSGATIPTPASADLSKIQITKLKTTGNASEWKATPQDSADGKITFTYEDYDDQYGQPHFSITVPASANIPAGSIIAIKVSDASCHYYDMPVNTPFNDSYMYIEVLPANEDVFVNFKHLGSSTASRPEDDANSADFLKQVTQSPSFGDREGTTGTIGAFIFGNRGGSDSAAKEVVYNFDTTNVAVKAASIGLPYAATSETDTTNRAPVGNGGVVQAWGDDGSGPYSYTLPTEYQNLTEARAYIISAGDFGMPDGVSIQKMSYQLTTIPQGYLMMAPSSDLQGAIYGNGLQYYGTIKNLGTESKSSIEVKDIANPTVTTGAGEFTSHLKSGMGVVGIDAGATVKVEAGTSATCALNIGTGGTFTSSNATSYDPVDGAGVSGCTTNPILYIRNDMVDSYGLVDTDTIVLKDIYGNPMVKDVDYTVTSTVTGNVQLVTIDTAGVTDERASLMTHWINPNGINHSGSGVFYAFGNTSHLRLTYSYTADYLATDDAESFQVLYYQQAPGATVGVAHNTSFTKLEDPYGIAKPGVTGPLGHQITTSNLVLAPAQTLHVASHGKLSTETNYRDAYNGTNAILLSPSQTLDFKTSFINTTGAGNSVKSAQVFIPVPKVNDDWGELLLDHDGTTKVDTTFDLELKAAMSNPDTEKYEIRYGKITPTDDGTTLMKTFTDKTGDIPFEIWNPNHASDYNCITIYVKENQEIPFIDVAGGTPEEIIAKNTTDFVAQMGLSTVNMPDEKSATTVVFQPCGFRTIEIDGKTNQFFNYDAPIGVSTSNVIVKFDANKTLSGSKGNTAIAADQFKFNVTLDSGAAANVSGLPTAPVGCAAGTAIGATVEFDTIRISDAGTYVFKIEETGTAPTGYTYDAKPVMATVKVVADKNTGELSIDSITYTKDDKTVTSPTFENKFEPLPTAATDSPAVSKTVSSHTPSDAGSFTFAIAADEANPVAGLMGMSATKTITTDTTKTEAKPFGSATFTKAGTYTFTITETAGTDSHYSYDGSEYTWTVVVKDNNGQLVVDANDTKLEKTKEKARGAAAPGAGLTEAAFDNAYTPTSGSWTPIVTKTVTGSVPAGTDETFTFKLTGTGIAAAGVTKTVTGAGSVSFDAINYTTAGTYTYQITEEAGTNTGYTYDKSVYDISVVVTDTSGTLNAVATVTKSTDKDGNAVTPATSADAITFDNAYAPAPAIVKIDPPVTKTISGDTPATASTFSFKMVGQANAPMPADATGDSVVRTLTGAGSVELGNITYTAPGTYTYKVTEEAGADTAYAYDTSEYTLTVVITDNGDGTLSDVQSLTKDGATVTALAFDNAYTTPPTPPTPPTPSGEAIVTVTKTVDKTTVKSGDELTYTLVVSNSGDADAVGIWVKDIVPANTTFISAESAVNTENGAVNWFVDKLGQGQMATLSFKVRVNDNLGSDVNILNTVQYENTDNPKPPTDYSKTPSGGESNKVGTVVNPTSTPTTSSTATTSTTATATTAAATPARTATAATAAKTGDTVLPITLAVVAIAAAAGLVVLARRKRNG